MLLLLRPCGGARRHRRRRRHREVLKGAPPLLELPAAVELELELEGWVQAARAVGADDGVRPLRPGGMEGKRAKTRRCVCVCLVPCVGKVCVGSVRVYRN